MRFSLLQHNDNLCCHRCMKMKTSHVLALAQGSYAAVGRFFDPPLSRQAVRGWGEEVPELRVRQLLERVPDSRGLLIDDNTGLTQAEKMAGVIAGAGHGR